MMIKFNSDDIIFNDIKMRSKTEIYEKDSSL